MTIIFDDEELKGTVELEAETVRYLIRGASDLYGPAFPDEDERKKIIEATDSAEEKLLSQQITDDQEDEDDTTTIKDLVDDIRRLDETVDGVPSETDMRERGQFHPAVYRYNFGSWEESLQYAGLNPEADQ